MRAFAAKSAFESVAVGLNRARQLSPLLHLLAGTGEVHMADWRTAAQSSTVIAAALWHWLGKARPAEWRAMFGVAARLTDGFVAAAEALPQLPARQPVSVEDDWAAGHYYAPCLRYRRHASFVRAGTRDPSNACRAAPKGCTKKVIRSDMFSPGVFVVTCGHAHVYGYSLMDAFESPKTPFDIFSHRVECPESTTIVYDNGCHLLAYGLARFPRFWAHSRVLVDCLHYHGHCTCAKCFDAAVYQFKNFNSQACEQVNAFLKRSAPSFHQMTSRSCMIWMFVHCAAWNMRRS